MRRGHLGLDELMIVNPDGGELRALFLGGDGALYRVDETGMSDGDAGARFFLGDDGTLYQVTSAPQR